MRDWRRRSDLGRLNAALKSAITYRIQPCKMAKEILFCSFCGFDVRVGIKLKFPLSFSHCLVLGPREEMKDTTTTTYMMLGEERAEPLVLVVLLLVSFEAGGDRNSETHLTAHFYFYFSTL